MLDLESCKKHVGRYTYMSMITMSPSTIPLMFPYPSRVKEVRKIMGVDEADGSVVLGPGIILDGSNVVKIGSDGSYNTPMNLLGNLVPTKTEGIIEDYIKNIDYFVEGEVL